MKSKEKTLEIVDKLTDRLRHLMVEHNIKAAPLARAAQLNESAVRDILRGRSRNPGIVTLERIAKVLHLRPSALFEAGDMWPINGDIADNGVVTFEDAKDSQDRYIENPFFLKSHETLAALYVADDSLAPFAFNGDCLLYRQDLAAPTSIDQKRPCLCETSDNKRLIRLIRPGANENDVNLLPVNPYSAMEMNQKIKWATPIIMVLPQDFSGPFVQPTHASTNTLQEESDAFQHQSSGK